MIRLGLATFLFSLSAHASVLHCDCPEQDAIAKENNQAKCASMPAGVDKELLNEPNQALCTKMGATTLKAAMRMILTPKGTKSWEETANYMSCYAKDSERYCHFRDTLAPVIDLAAQSTGLPAAIQSCIVLQESKLNPNAKNESSGALGYIQFMPGTDDTLDFVVQKKEVFDDWKNEIAKNKRRLKEFNLKLAELKEENAKLAKQKKALKDTSKTQQNINYLEARNLTLGGRIRAKDAWDLYWKGTKTPPTKISMESTKCPQVAMILMMIKQLNDLYLMQALDEDFSAKGALPQINGINTRDSAILLAGSYNRGIGGFARACGDVKSLNECVQRFKKGHETRNYMESVDACSKKGSYEPTSSLQRKACEGFKCF